MEEEKEIGLKYPCVKCGEKEAVVGKASGKPTHGMCRECFAVRFRAAYARKREKKEQLKIEAAAKEIVEDIRGDNGPSYPIGHLLYEQIQGESIPPIGTTDASPPPYVDAAAELASAIRSFDAPITRSLAHQILLDLGPYPEIEEWINQLAKDEFRTVEYQILWELKGLTDFARRCDGKEDVECRA